MISRVFFLFVSRIFCGIWTQFDKNIVLTGGEDSMLMAWDITKQQDKMPAKKSTKFKAPREKQANLITAVDSEGIDFTKIFQSTAQKFVKYYHYCLDFTKFCK